MLSKILYILLSVVILGVIIMLHELGHFLVGRWCGIGVVEFSIGFGPRLCGFERKGTKYSLRAIPLGGFCSFVGEDEENPASNAMNNANVWKRIATVFAGPGMNFVLAFVAGIALLCAYYVADVYPTVDVISQNSAAETAGFLEGDVITQVNGEALEQNINGVRALRALIQTGESLNCTVQRGDENVNISVVPDTFESEDGATGYQLGITFRSRNYNLLEAIPASGKMMVNVTEQLFDTLRNLIFHGQGADEVTGTVGTVVVISEVVRQDTSRILDILFLISLNLGIMNLLPLPALDGGRLVFLFFEVIRGKPVPPDKEGMVHLIGFGLFIVLFVVLTWHDIANLGNLIQTVGGAS